MIPYIVLYCIIFIFHTKIQPKKWAKIDFFILLVLVLFSGLRFLIGTDYVLYERMYNALTIHTINDSRTGLGYNIIAFFFKNINFNFQSFIFVCSLVTNVLIYYFLKKTSQSPGMSLLVYLSMGFYTFSFNGFRQALSMAIFLFGYTKKIDKKHTSMVFCFFISFFIHSISGLGIAVSLILSIFPKFKISFKKMLPIILIAYVFFDKIFQLIIEKSTGYNYYLDSTEQYSAGLGTLFRIAQYLFIYHTVFFIYQKRNEQLADNNSEQEKMAKLGIMIMIFSSKNWLIYRLALQFLVFSTIFMPRFNELRFIREEKFQFILLHSAMLVSFILNIVSFDGVFPYRSLIFSGS